MHGKGPVTPSHAPEMDCHITTQSLQTSKLNKGGVDYTSIAPFETEL